MRTVLAIGVFTLGLFGCDADHPCDPGQQALPGACLPMPTGGAMGGAMQPDAGVDASSHAEHDAASASVAAGSDGGGDGGAADAGAASCDEPVTTSLGRDCTTDADCGCGAPFCAAMPGASSGLCTISGCSTMPDDCPDGYMCFDLSAVGVMGYDPFCLPSS